MKLFLDDYRIPFDCVKYMHSRIGKDNFDYLDLDWDIVRSYDEFVKYIEDNHLPELISFDHDLSDQHYGALYYSDDNLDDYHMDIYEGKTGYHCAIWLIQYCLDKKIDNLPKYYVHSMNPGGAKAISDLLGTYDRIKDK